MPSIASLSAKVREKDAEKSKILNEIKDLEGLKSQNIVGQLLFVVQTVGNVSAEYITDLKVQPSECNLSVTKLTNLVCNFSSSPLCHLIDSLSLWGKKLSYS
jgi:predicted Ser/Thr protein kinase